jgi:hypothetical protein
MATKDDLDESMDRLAETALRVKADRDRLLAVVQLPLMFHSGRPWSELDRRRWQEITGTEEATAKVMCDTIRDAIAQATA